MGKSWTRIFCDQIFGTRKKKGKTRIYCDLNNKPILISRKGKLEWHNKKPRR